MSTIFSRRDNNGITVVAKKGEPFESLMNRFKRKVTNSKILHEVRMFQEFEKPCEKKNRKKRESIRRSMKLKKKEY